MRVFAAIDISYEARIKVTSHIERLRSEFRSIRVGWEKPEKLHVTLKFFGDVADDRIGDLQTSLDEIASRHSPFIAELSETGVFPNGRRPRVLWIGIQHDGDVLATLRSEIEQQSQGLGFPPEKRAFSPHLTIARLREPERSGGLAERHLVTDFDVLRFDVKEIVLYQSKLLPSGSVYSVVSRSALA